jgi:IS1 family transposase
MFVVMNRLSFEKRRQILHLMVEGNGVRAIARIVDVSPVTVLRYLELAGTACAEFHDDNVRNVKARRVQCDEIWSFCYAKQKNVAKAKAAPADAGDVWTWTALDADSKLIVSWLVGGRSAEYAVEFIADLRDRLANRVQLTTDAHGAYLYAVEETDFDVDYAQLIKIYGTAPESAKGRYSPAVCLGTRKTRIMGKPDEAYVNTSFVEKHNQSMRQHMRRFTRLTTGHSKKFANHVNMVALYTVWYNYARINSADRMSPAMAAGISDRLWDVADIVRLIEAAEDQPSSKL